MNLLLESIEVGGDTTVYEWDDTGRLVNTAVDSVNGRSYAYDQRGNLTSALVDNLLTTFVYDGDGRRLQTAVAGEVVTYTLDYAGGGRVLLEEGGAFSDTKHYIYGLECIAELVNADEPDSEWRYYHQDGNHLVRQTTNIQATVTLAWTYSPDGAIVLGEEGPVTHLGCDGNTTYDFSTGLIFKNGRYFDPNTGIWLTLSGLVVWNEWQTSVKNRNKKRQRRKRLFLLLLLFLVIITLVGCGGNSSGSTPIPDPTATCTPTNTPMPTLPPPFNTPNPTVGPPNTPTPRPTTAPSPTWTPFPTHSDPLAGFQLANPLGENEPYYWVCEFGATYCGQPDGNHNGLDLVSVSYISASCSGTPGCTDVENPPSAATIGFRKVYSPVSGNIKERVGSTIRFYNIKNNLTSQIIPGLEAELTHVDNTFRPELVKDSEVRAGDWLSYFVGDPKFPFPHLHLGMTYNGINRNPLDWLRGSNVGYYFNAYQTLPRGL